MGYRGKTEAQEQARALRYAGLTMPEIAARLSVSRSSVSLWTRDIETVPTRRRAVVRQPNSLQVRKQAEVAAFLAAGAERVGALSERDLLVAGAALYAGEGSKRDGDLVFTNTDPRLVGMFCSWLRLCFGVDESKFRVRLYLHEGLDLNAAVRHWSTVTAIPAEQFTQPYRAATGPRLRKVKHEFGCASVRYLSTSTHRAIMGVVAALLSSPPAIPG